MKFIAIINREVKLGYALNGLGHMTLGLGHRLDGAPDVGIYFANATKVREFRQLASTITREQLEHATFSDFPHTMHGGDTPKQLEVGKNTPESDMQYFGSCFITEKLDARMVKLLSSCSKLKDYTPHFSHEEAKLLPSQKSTGDNDITGKKTIMLINNKQPMSQTLNAAILSALRVGKRAKHAELRLLDVMDKDGNAHSNISFHPFPILKPTNPAKHSEMAEKAEKSKSLVSGTESTTDGQPLVTVVFGNESEVADIAPKALARLFDNNLKDTDFVPASGDELNVSESKLEKVISVVSDEKAGDKSKLKQGKMPLQFSLGDKSVLTGEVLKQIETVIDKASTAARSIDTSVLKERLNTDVIAIKKLVRNENKSAEYIQKLISDVLSEASGGGQLESVKYIVGTYSQYITSDDFYHSAQYAQTNKHDDICQFLNGLKATPASGM